MSGGGHGLGELTQWISCGVILLAALALLAWKLGWLPRRGGKPALACGGGCPKCGAVEQMAKRLEQLP
jgi:hypothetical protein